MLLFSINRSRGYENPSLDIIVTERCSIGGCPLEEACEHCYLIQSAISVAISYIISVYCEDYAGYFTVILSFLAFRFCSAYFVYLVSCRANKSCILIQNKNKIILKLFLKYYTSDSGIHFNQAIFEFTMVVVVSTFLKTTEPVFFLSFIISLSYIFQSVVFFC
jgi:hypothetical protein